MGVLTRNLKSHARLALAKMDVHHLFAEESVLGRHEAAPKPDPDGILALMRLWSAAPEDTVMVRACTTRHEMMCACAHGLFASIQAQDDVRCSLCLMRLHRGTG